MRSRVAVLSSRIAPLALFALGILGMSLSGCVGGQGEGIIEGAVYAEACELDLDDFVMAPGFFGASALHGQLEIRLQRTSGLPNVRDALSVTLLDVEDAAARLGEPLALGLDPHGEAQMNLLLYEECPLSTSGREATVLLAAVEGEIVFEAIYSPELSDELTEEGGKRIAGSFESVRFEDPAQPDRVHATLSGHFDFLYNRGRPAQLFP